MTGVLPIALAKATRIVSILLTSPKGYSALMHLHKDIDDKKLNHIFDEFRGDIKQTPPRRSAVKRQERRRTIYALDLLERQGQEVLFHVSCQAGTYIRTLIHHIGLKLGTGAHMTQLIRTKTGPFAHKTWHTLQDLKDAVEFYKQGNDQELRKIILPVEEALADTPKIWVHDSAVNSLCHGSSLGIPGVSKLSSSIQPQQIVAMMTLKGELIGLAKASLSAQDILQKEKGLAATTTTIFMDRNIYPAQKKV